MGTSQFVIDDGLQDVVFKNNKGEVFSSFSFNPSDTGLLTRYDELVEFLDSVTIEDGEVDKQIIQLEKTIKEMIDKLFNRKISEDVFKMYAPCTIFANGDMFIEVLIRHIGEVIEGETDKRLKKKVAKIKKATAKNRA